MKFQKVNLKTLKVSEGKTHVQNQDLVREMLNTETHVICHAIKSSEKDIPANTTETTLMRKETIIPDTVQMVAPKFAIVMTLNTTMIEMAEGKTKNHSFTNPVQSNLN